MKRLLAALATAAAVAGCGEIPNTITPQPGTANDLTVVLDGPANATHVGIYYAAALGYFRQADLNVHLETPSAAGQPLGAIEAGRAQVALASEPDVLLGRNQFHPLAAVGAILQAPAAPTITCQAPKPKPGRKRAGATCKPTPGAIPRQYRGAPTYNGLVFTVTEHEIVAHAPLIRRFVQAVARGYRAARANPAAATQALAKAVPPTTAKHLATEVRASMPLFFPTGGHPWGWQSTSQWNAFGAWMTAHHLITNQNATPDASTNELLAGQGV